MDSEEEDVEDHINDDESNLDYHEEAIKNIQYAGEYHE